MSEVDNKQKDIQSSELQYQESIPEQVGNNLGAVRWVANGMQLVGYYMLINNSFTLGLFIKGISDLLIMTWAVRNKLWDVVGVTAIFCIFNFQRFSELEDVGGLVSKLLHLVVTQ